MFFKTLTRLWESGTRRGSSRSQRTGRRGFSPRLEEFESRLVPSAIIFQDNMENGTNGWVTTGSDGYSNGSVSLWHQAQDDQRASRPRSNSPTHSWYYGSESSRTYDTAYTKRDPKCIDPWDPGCYTTVYTANWGTLTSPAINLAGSSRATLSFAEWSQVEPATNRDRTMVEVSTDGTHFKQVFESHGTNGAWVTRLVDVSAYAGKTIYVRFHFDSVNASNNYYEGWYVDDVAVYSGPALSVNDVQVKEGNSGTTNAAFTVSLSAASTQPVTVHYAMVGGTATAGSDYQPTSGILTFAPGETSKVINVPVYGDTINEPNETFFLDLSSATNAAIADSRGVGTILDDDVPGNILYSTYLGGSYVDQIAGFAVDTAGNMDVAGTTGSANFPVTNGTTLQGMWDGYATRLNADGTLAWSTYLGGSNGAQLLAMTQDGSGNIYLTGVTNSIDFPTTWGAYQAKYPGNPASINVGFVTKLDGATGALLYSTYLSGSNSEPHGIAVDASGDAYVVGETTAADYPTTDRAWDRNLQSNRKAFVTKLNATGSSLVYSTFLGGTSQYDAGSANRGYSIAVDGSGNAWVTGVTVSDNFPTTTGAFQTALNGYGDGFVTQLNANGSELLYSSYLGGTGVSYGDDPDEPNRIKVDSSGNAYVTGETRSTDFPVTTGALQTTFGGGDWDGFVAKIDPTKTGASSLVFSTYLGGSGGDWTGDVGIDAAGNLLIVGGTTSTDFPTAGVSNRTLNGTEDAFVANLSPAGTQLVYASYLGGSGGDGAVRVALDAAGNIYAVGSTTSLDFPVTGGAFDSSPNGDGEIFLTKLTTDPMATINSVSVTEGNAGTVSATFTVSLSTASTKTVTVNWATADGNATAGSDYHAASGALTFAPGETSRTITVLVDGDTLNEADETFFVNLNGAVNAWVGTRGTGTIVNDDPLPTLAINGVQKLEGTSGTSAFAFTVSLSAPSGQTVTVNYSTASGTATAGTDYLAQSGTLTFTPGETSKTITILVYGDKTKEADETFFVNLSGAWNVFLADSQGLGKILNDD
jgi:hypothetical protein